MRPGAKRLKRVLAEPWYGRLLPAMTEVMLAFALVTGAALTIEAGKGAAKDPVDASHYSARVRAPLA